MSYRALYRVFRPQQFSAVIGQDHISTTLKNALLSDRLAHAYLFCGPRGTGKTSSAKILAKAVNCLNLQEGEPCNQCENCQAINQESFLDVLEIDAASNRGIDEIRDLRDKIRFAPAQGKRKVYIIDEVHMLTTEAFNALLKTLEEPPSHVLFILATTDPQKIPLTVLSRCQRFDFRKINTEEIKQHLAEIVAEEQVTISEPALNTIARKASGGMRDAISILDQCIAFAGKQVEISHIEMVLGTISEEDTASLLQTVLQEDYQKLFDLLTRFAGAGKEMKQILRDLIEYCRQLLMLKVATDGQLVNLSENVLPIANQQAKQLSLPQLSKIINRLSEAEKDLRFSNQPQILLETALVDLILQQAQPAVTQASPAPTTTTPSVATAKNTSATPPQAVRKLIASESLIQQWGEMMQLIKQHSVKLHAFLTEATPASFTQGELIIRFPAQYKFHFNTVSQIDNLRKIEQIITQNVGQPVKVLPQLENEQGIIPQELTLAEETAKLFGSNVIEIKD